MYRYKVAVGSVAPLGRQTDVQRESRRVAVIGWLGFSGFRFMTM